jgi:hypothetical protein
MLRGEQGKDNPMNWSQGYVADIAYTANFYRETAPMAFAALSVGRSPGRALRPNRMLELGFGQGFGLSLLAAANPDVQFEGHDFNPEHVAHARRLIANAKLDNITVTESSFEEAAERGGTTSMLSRYTASTAGSPAARRMRSSRSFVSACNPTACSTSHITACRAGRRSRQSGP